MIAFDNVDLLMLVTIFILLLVLIFTSVAEMALSRITKPKAASLADQGFKSGKALKKLVGAPERWVNPLLLTVNVCQTVQATLTGILSARSSTSRPMSSASCSSCWPRPCPRRMPCCTRIRLPLPLRGRWAGSWRFHL